MEKIYRSKINSYKNNKIKLNDTILRMMFQKINVQGTIIKWIKVENNNIKNRKNFNKNEINLIIWIMLILKNNSLKRQNNN